MLGFQFFGINLAHHRTRQRYSQQELARRAGRPFSQAVISRFENGLRPSERHIEILAHVLGVPTGSLLIKPRIVRRSREHAVLIEDAAGDERRLPPQRGGARSTPRRLTRCRCSTSCRASFTTTSTTVQVECVRCFARS